MTRTETVVVGPDEPTLPMGTPIKLGVRRVSRAHLALDQRPLAAAELSAALTPVASLLGERLKVPVELSARLVERALEGRPELAPFAAYAVFELAARGTTALLEIELGSVVALVDRLSGGATRPAPVRRLSAIEEGAFGFLLLHVLSSLRSSPRVGAWSPRLLWLGTDRPFAREQLAAEGQLLQVEVEIRTAGTVHAARLWIAAPALEAALVIEPVSKPVTNLPAVELGAAGLWCRVFMGSSPLHADEVEALREGDVVLFDVLSLHDGAIHGPAHLVFPNFVLAGRFGPDGFSPTRATPRGQPPELPMNADHPELDPASVPLDVEVELTRLRVTLAELSQLKPGALFPLRIGVSDPVTLRVGDRAVARAELVDIDGEVGARVLSLLP